MTSSVDSLEALEPFVGEWRLEAAFENLPPVDAGARASFEWLPGNRFLIQRWEVPVPEAPDGIAMIGPDPGRAGSYLQGRSATTARPGSTTSTSRTAKASRRRKRWQ